MFELLMFCCFDELVGHMVVDPDAAHTESEHTQGVLVIVGQRAVADWMQERRSKLNQITLNHNFTAMFEKLWGISVWMKSDRKLLYPC